MKPTIADLKREAAEIRRFLKIKTLSKYSREKAKKRLQSISDLLCGFNG